MLLYHVVAGNVSSSQLKDGEQVPSLLKGHDLLVNILPPRNNFPAQVLIDRDSRVLYANNYATNGVFHVIDRVLIPRPLTEYMSKAFYPAATAPALNLVQRLQLIPEYSTLVTAVVAGGLAGALSGAGPFTVFTPDDFACACHTRRVWREPQQPVAPTNAEPPTPQQLPASPLACCRPC